MFVALGFQVDQKKISQFSNSMGNAKIQALGVAAAVTTAAFAVIKFSDAAVRYAVELKNFAVQTGLSVSELERWRFVAEQNDVDRIIDYAAEHVDPTITGETVLTVGKAVEAMREDYDGVFILGPFACLPFRISEGILKPLFLENDFAFLSYETDARAVPPAFLRLVDVHIQQILRNHRVKTMSAEFTRLKVVDSV